MRPLSVWEQYPEAVEALKAAYKAGDSATTIAGNLGRQFGVSLTRNAIIGKTDRLGIRTKKIKQHQAKQTRRYRRAPWAVARHPGLATDLATEVALNPVGIYDIEPTQCRWPIDGHGLKTATLFCGNPAFEKKSYCAHHCCIAFAIRPRLNRAELELHQRKLAKNHKSAA